MDIGLVGVVRGPTRGAREGSGGPGALGRGSDPRGRVGSVSAGDPCLAPTAAGSRPSNVATESQRLTIHGFPVPLRGCGRIHSGERNPESEIRRAKAGERKPESESRRAKAGE